MTLVRDLLLVQAVQSVLVVQRYQGLPTNICNIILLLANNIS